MTKLLPSLSQVPLLALIPLIASVPAVAGEFTGSANFVLGQKILSENDWEPIEEQPAGAAELTWGSSDWPIMLATDFVYSVDDEESSGLDVDGSTLEIGVGIRETLQAGSNFNYYLGAGIGLIRADVEVETSSGEVEDDDVAGSYWLNAGVYWRLGSRFNLGAGARYSYGKADIDEEDIRVGGFHYGLLLGWGWPASN